MKELEEILKNSKDIVYHGGIYSGRGSGKSKYLDIISERLTKNGLSIKRVKPTK